MENYSWKVNNLTILEIGIPSENPLSSLGQKWAVNLYLTLSRDTPQGRLLKVQRSSDSQFYSYEKLKSSWLNVSTAKQKLRHQCIINITLKLNPKHSTMQATRKKITFIPAQNRTGAQLVCNFSDHVHFLKLWDFNISKLSLAYILVVCDTGVLTLQDVLFVCLLAYFPWFYMNFIYLFLI